MDFRSKSRKNYRPVADDPLGKLLRCCPHCLDDNRRCTLKLTRRRKNGDGVYFCSYCRKASVDYVGVVRNPPAPKTDQASMEDF